MNYSVYVLFNFDTRRFYIGLTSNLDRRFLEHQRAKLSHRNVNFKPVFIEMFYNKEDAQKRERYLKSSKGKFTLRAMLKGTLKVLV